MIAIEDTLVSEDLLDKKFVCDLGACKGECCVAGDSGAPLEEEELSILEEIFPLVKPYMNEEGINTIEEQGMYLVDYDGDFVTPLVDGHKHCAFTIFPNGIASCAIEKAYNEKKISFKKPISCHLYPVRINKYKEFTAVNYHTWDVCKPARQCGKKLDVKVYKFLKEPLIRKFGEKWYESLVIADKLRSA